VQAQVRDGFGVWRPAEFTIGGLHDSPDGGALVVHLRDVSERRELEHALHRTVRTDPLTGVVNRTALREAMAATDDARGTLLTIGLDGLGGINDAHGPEIGDAMLVEVARRVRATIGPDDVAARLSGDEFAVHTAADRIPAYTLATRLVGELSEPYRLPGTVLHLSAGIGLAEAVGTDTDEALRRAGLALRRAKRAGRGRVEWHDDEVEAAYVRRVLLEQHLPEAVARGQLDLAYQPVYDLVEGKPVGVEALLRWRHPTLGTVLPLETLAVARELGITGQIHDWVLNRACRQLSRWQHEGYQLWLSVNVCFDDLLAPGFPADLVIELAERDLDGGWERTITPLTTVRAFGVRTALDGFGTGATSLAHLRRLPADLLKVDRSLFVEPAGTTAPVTPIIDAVVELGNRLNVTVVAQGIESQSDVELVRGAGCRYGQGHRYGQPAPAERIEAELMAVT
jgi:diguanylate cyclase (GGDEF)-like protein